MDNRLNIKKVGLTLLVSLAQAQTTPALSFYDKVSTQFDGVT